MTMSNTFPNALDSSQEDLSDEYRFDYQTAKPNRFAVAHSEPTKIIVLDEDVARVFTTSEAVNKILRALIQSMPHITPPQISES